MGSRFTRSIVWLRRDLRLDDHAALHQACAQSDEVVCIFVLDPDLLRGPRVGAPIVGFFFSALTGLRADLRAHGSDLALLEGDFADELVRFAKKVDAQAVFYNVDYDPGAISRDERVEAALRNVQLTVSSFVDHVYADASEVTQSGGRPYTVFTPFSRKWLATFDGGAKREPYRSRAAALRKLVPAAAIGRTREIPKPEDYGHRSSPDFPTGDEASAKEALRTFLARHGSAYRDERNEPALDATSHLSPHLRAGTIGIRTCVAAALDAKRNAKKPGGFDTWLNELIWREFYQHVLKHVPRVAHEPFIEDAAHIPWRDDEDGWKAWADGTTGYPIVDAAMQQINRYGWMHNRLRMIVASFLTKDLLIDYHEGERYFEQHLADGDLAQNNGGWQWSASTGTDAAPYFRVFNPVLQGQKFDPSGAFVRRMLPALAKVPDAYVHEPWEMPPLVAAEAGCVIGRDYPAPIVDHFRARERAIEVFGAVLRRKSAAPRASGAIRRRVSSP